MLELLKPNMITKVAKVSDSCRSRPDNRDRGRSAIEEAIFIYLGSQTVKTTNFKRS